MESTFGLCFFFTAYRNGRCKIVLVYFILSLTVIRQGKKKKVRLHSWADGIHESLCVTLPTPLGGRRAGADFSALALGLGCCTRCSEGLPCTGRVKRIWSLTGGPMRPSCMFSERRGLWGHRRAPPVSRPRPGDSKDPLNPQGWLDLLPVLLPVRKSRWLLLSL